MIRVLLLSLLCLSSLNTAIHASTLQIPDTVTTPAQTQTSTEVVKYTQLGRLYKQRYLETLLLKSLLDVRKYSVSSELLETFKKQSIISLDSISIPDISTHFSEPDNASVFNVTYQPPTFTILKPLDFFNTLSTTDELMYFPARSKTGSWWVYLDTSKALAWESYFWMAFFIDQGFAAELSSELEMIILGNFQTAEEALFIKDKFKELPISVSFVTLRKFQSRDPDVRTLRTPDASMILQTIPETITLQPIR